LTFCECLERNFDSSSLQNVPKIPATEFPVWNGRYAKRLVI
jgi:hypothetical protein